MPVPLVETYVSLGDSERAGRHTGPDARLQPSAGAYPLCGCGDIGRFAYLWARRWGLGSLGPPE